MCHGNYQLLYHEINIGRWVHWALRFGADCLKIKLLEITEEVGVWMTHNHGPILVTALLQCQNKKIHLRQRQSKVILKDRLSNGWDAGYRAHPAPKCSARYSQKYESNHKENVLAYCLKSRHTEEPQSTLGNCPFMWGSKQDQRCMPFPHTLHPVILFTWKKLCRKNIW